MCKSSFGNSVGEEFYGMFDLSLCTFLEKLSNIVSVNS